MRHTTAILGLLVLASVGHLDPVWSQDCSAVFRLGPFDENETTFQSQAYQALRDIVLSSQDYETATKLSGEMKVVIEEVPLAGKAARDDWAKWKSTFLHESSSVFMQQVAFRESSKKASPTLVNAWTKCVSAPGFHWWLERTESLERYTVAMKYVPTSETMSVIVREIHIAPPASAHFDKPPCFPSP